MEKKLWKLILRLQKSAAGRFIVSIAYNCGLIYVWNFFAYENDRKHPTEEMQRSRAFFKKNKKRINKNLELLVDAESKDTYKRIVKYRITHNHRDRPYYNRKDQYFPSDIVKIQGGYKVC